MLKFKFKIDKELTMKSRVLIGELNINVLCYYQNYLNWYSTQM